LSSEIGSRSILLGKSSVKRKRLAEEDKRPKLIEGCETQGGWKSKLHGGVYNREMWTRSCRGGKKINNSSGWTEWVNLKGEGS